MDSARADLVNIDVIARNIRARAVAERPAAPLARNGRAAKGAAARHQTGCHDHTQYKTEFHRSLPLAFAIDESGDLFERHISARQTPAVLKHHRRRAAHAKARREGGVGRDNGAKLGSAFGLLARN